MPAPRRLKALVPLALLAAVSLVACGDSGSGAVDASDPAASRAAAKRIIARATGVNEHARSGRVDATVTVDIKGIERFAGPIELTANGVWDLPDGADVPDVDMDVAVGLRGGLLGGGIVVADEQGYIKLGNAGYKLPAKVSRFLVAPARDARNGLTKTGAMFSINPHEWQRDARVLGEESVAGEPTHKLTAEVLPARAFEDLARLVHFLTLINVTQALDLPPELTPRMQAALVRSITDVEGQVWVGSEDRVVRKARLSGRAVVAKRDRKVLLGATSGTLDATLNISEVGEPQEIGAPKQLDSYDDLKLSLDALAEAAGAKRR